MPASAILLLILGLLLAFEGVLACVLTCSAQMYMSCDLLQTLSLRPACPSPHACLYLQLEWVSLKVGHRPIGFVLQAHERVFVNLYLFNSTG